MKIYETRLGTDVPIMLREVRTLDAETVNNIATPAEVCQLLKNVFDASALPEENVWMICLNNQNNITGIFCVAIGFNDGCLVRPREVFQKALLANASGIILAHNHPSGNPTPSELDIQVTENIRKAGELLQIPLMDHVIIGRNSYFSFIGSGLLREAS